MLKPITDLLPLAGFYCSAIPFILFVPCVIVLGLKKIGDKIDARDGSARKPPEDQTH